jgi:hypothetical protein
VSPLASRSGGGRRAGTGELACCPPLLRTGEEVDGGQGDGGGHGEEQGLVAGHGDQGGAEGDGDRLRGGDQRRQTRCATSSSSGSAGRGATRT